jgi:hypothetical protein
MTPPAPGFVCPKENVEGSALRGRLLVSPLRSVGCMLCPIECTVEGTIRCSADRETISVLHRARVVREDRAVGDMHDQPAPNTGVGTTTHTAPWEWRARKVPEKQRLREEKD